MGFFDFLRNKNESIDIALEDMEREIHSLIGSVFIVFLSLENISVESDDRKKINEAFECLKSNIAAVSTAVKHLYQKDCKCGASEEKNVTALEAVFKVLRFHTEIIIRMSEKYNSHGKGIGEAMKKFRACTHHKDIIEWMEQESN